MTEDKDGALTDERVDPPFSDLMRRWLEEGDRLSENVATSRAAAASRAETPLGQALLRLRAGVERHRLFVLAGVGLLPLALFLATQRGTPVPAVSASVSALAPAVRQVAVAAPTTKAAPAARPVAVAAPGAPARQPGRHRHHHHHHSIARRSR